MAALSLALLACGSDKPSSVTEVAADSGVAADTASASASDGSAAGSNVGAVVCPPADGSAKKAQSFASEPPICIDAAKTYVASFETNQGAFAVTLDAKKAPKTVNSFVFLARNHYFDDTVCHRVVKGFVVQCGDPTASGTGGPGYTIEDELPTEPYKIGSLAMANTGQPHTGGSQFFLITGAQGVALPPNYSLFGQLTKGDDLIPKLDSLAGGGDGPPTQEIRITKVTITES